MFKQRNNSDIESIVKANRLIMKKIFHSFFWRVLVPLHFEKGSSTDA